MIITQVAHVTPETEQEAIVLGTFGWSTMAMQGNVPLPQWKKIFIVPVKDLRKAETLTNLLRGMESVLKE
jgi:hypothetical protein